MNITLIGMPGCGKSTIGVILARDLGLNFVDVDLVIQQKEGRLLREIIAQEGTEEFRRIENRVNAELFVENSVIAPGGSVIYGREAMEHWRTTSHLVYLQLSCDELKNRLGDLERRGVSLAPGQTLEELYQERCPLYEKWAQLTVSGEGASMGEVMERVKNGVLREWGSQTTCPMI